MARTHCRRQPGRSRLPARRGRRDRRAARDARDPGRRSREAGDEIAPRAARLADINYCLAFLAHSVALGSEANFADYVAWARIAMKRRGAAAGTLARRLHLVAGILRNELPHEHANLVTGIVDRVLARLPEMPCEAPSFVSEANPNGALAGRYLQALLRCNREEAHGEARAALASGIALKSLYTDVFAASQREIGRLWQLNEISVAQEHYCTAATQLVMAQVSAGIFAGPKPGPTVVSTCPGGELHEFGARMVADFFEMAGWRTIHLGSGTPAPDVVGSVVASGAEVLAVSASLAFNVPAAQALIGAVRADARCRDVSVIVGGHPFNVDPALWRLVGADGCAPDADSAVALAAQLRERRR